MNDRGQHDESLERIRSRARELLISGGPETADAETLAAFVDGTLSLDQISDATVGHWIDLFGSSALVDDRLKTHLETSQNEPADTSTLAKNLELVQGPETEFPEDLGRRAQLACVPAGRSAAAGKSNSPGLWWRSPVTRLVGTTVILALAATLILSMRAMRPGTARISPGKEAEQHTEPPEVGASPSPPIVATIPKETTSLPPRAQTRPEPAKPILRSTGPDLWTLQSSSRPIPSDSWEVTAPGNGAPGLGPSSAQDKPTVVVVSPSRGYEAAPTNTRVNVLVANFQARSAFVRLSKGSTLVPSQCSLLPEARGIRIVPDKALDPNTTFTISIWFVSTRKSDDTQTITILDTFDSTFSTGTQPIVAPPEVISVDLEGGAVDTPTSTKITLEFTSPMDAASFDQTDASGLVLLDSAGKVVPSTIGVSNTLKTATLTPMNLLASGAEYTVKVGNAVTDLAGNPLAGYTSKSFTTH